MKYSHNWLQEYIAQDLPSSKIIEDVLNAKAFEVESVEEISYFEEVENKNTVINNEIEKVEVKDFIYDIKVLPNRAHDALCHVGMARELAACLDLTFKKEEVEKYENLDNFKKIKLEDGRSVLDILEKKESKVVERVGLKIVEDKSCTRFMDVRIDGVVVGDSPLWLKNKLESIGQRSINNIVDITNYVQYTLNKPMHAYDSRNIVGDLHTRYANENEILVTLDDKELILNQSGSEKVLVISDNEKALGLAGIKGGKYSGVNPDTTSIVIESANFNPVLIRKTSQKYNIKTDASKRFENGISDTLVESGLCMTISEILKLFPDAKVGEISDTSIKEIKNYRSGVTLKIVNSILGSEITESEIENILKRLGFEYEKVNTIEKLNELIQLCVDKNYKRGASVIYDAPEYFDCSSLTNYLYKESREHIPRISIDQYIFSKEVKKEDARFGDLVFTNSSVLKTKPSVIYSQVLGRTIQDIGIRTESLEFMTGTKVENGIDHVAFYLGSGNILHAVSSNGKVLIENIQESIAFSNQVYYRRPFESLEGISYIVNIPHERLDLRTKEELTEEIGRIYGYEKLVPTLPVVKNENKNQENSSEIKTGNINQALNIQNIIRNILNKRDFSEVITYSLTEKGNINLVKAASDKNRLRSNISDGLLEAVNKNLNNMPLLNLDIIKMYEFGSVFSLDDEEKIKESLHLAISVCDGKKKSDTSKIIDIFLEEIKRKLNISEINSEIKSQKPYTIEINFDNLIELVHNLSENTFLELSSEENNRLENLKYKIFSQMPFVVRDITFWCDQNTDKLEILELIKNHAGKLCININIFDEFIKNIELKDESGNILDKKTIKSLGYRLVYQDNSRTLTDEEVNKHSDVIYNILKNKNFEIR